MIRPMNVWYLQQRRSIPLFAPPPSPWKRISKLNHLDSFLLKQCQVLHTIHWSNCCFLIYNFRGLQEKGAGLQDPHHLPFVIHLSSFNYKINSWFLCQIIIQWFFSRVTLLTFEHYFQLTPKGFVHKCIYNRVGYIICKVHVKYYTIVSNYLMCH